MSTKKQKKSKGKTLSLQEFTASLESGAKGQNVVYTPQAPSSKSWADEVDDDEYADSTKMVKVILPSAPRAARGPDFNEDEIPTVPPFIVHMGNISFDIDESDVYDFFKDLEVVKLHLPRDGNNRLRGFGYVHFQKREHLIEALCMNEQMLNGRGVRISLGQSQGEGGDRRGGGRNAPDETPDDWRSAPPTQLDAPPPSRGFNNDRYDFPGGRSDNYGSDFRGRSDFGGSRGGGSDFGRRPYGAGRFDNEGGADFGGRRGDYGDRDRGRNFGGRDRDGSGFRDRQDGSDEETASTWRSNVVARPEPPYPERQDDRFNRQGRDGDSRDRHYNSRSREMSPDFSDARSRLPPRTQSPEFTRPPPQARRQEEPEREERKPSPPRERRKLVIAPRTVTQSASDTAVSSSAIFGGARPVDTAAREREIEKKLAEQEEPRRVRLLQRPQPDASSPRDNPPPTPSDSSQRLPTTSQSDSPPEADSIKASDSSSHKSDSAPPPPSNAWAGRSHRREAEDELSAVERTSEGYEDGEDGGSSRDHQQSPHPDSDHKDTNSEPEDERDLRLQREEADDFQRVERRGRKPKAPSLPEQTHRPPPQRGMTPTRGAPRGAPAPPRRGNF